MLETIEVSDATAYYLSGGRSPLLCGAFSLAVFQATIPVLRDRTVGADGMRGQAHAKRSLEQSGSASQSKWVEPVFLGSPVGAGGVGGHLAGAFSRGDAAAGGNRTRAAAPTAAETSRPSQTTPRDRVCDWG